MLLSADGNVIATRIRRTANSAFDVGLAAGRKLALDPAAEEALLSSPY